MVEFHITLNRSMFGTDQSASVELPGMTTLLKYIRNVGGAMGEGKWTVYESEQRVKAKLRKDWIC